MKRRARSSRASIRRGGLGLLHSASPLRKWIVTLVGQTSTRMAQLVTTLVTTAVTAIGESPSLRRWLACICVLLSFSALSLHAHTVVASWPAFQPRALTLSLTRLPPWLHPVAGRQLARVIQQTQTTADQPASLLDPTRTTRLAALLTEESWIADVPRVQGEWPGDLTIRLTIRRPVAVVSWSGADWLLDDAGLALPTRLFRYRTPGEGSENRGISETTALVLPRLTGLPRAGLGPGIGQGSAERDRALRHGLSVVRDLNQRDMVTRLPVAAIDLANVGGRESILNSEVVLVSPEGTRVEWGRSSASSRLQQTTATKLDHLDAILSRSPSLQAVQSLSLRWDEQVFVPQARPVPEQIPEPQAQPTSNADAVDETNTPDGA